MIYRLGLGGGAVFLGLHAWLLTGFPKPDHLMPHGVMMVFGVLGAAALHRRDAGRLELAGIALFQLLGFLSWYLGALHIAALAIGSAAYARRLPAIAASLVLSFWWPLASALVALHLLAWVWRDRRPHALFAAVLFGCAWLHPEFLSTVHLAGLGGLALLSTRWMAWPLFAAALGIRLSVPELFPLAAGLGAAAMLIAAVAGPPR